MTSPADGAGPDGRALVESGAPISGSMTRAVAGLLYDPTGSRLRIDVRTAGCLRTAAAESAALVLPGERARTGAALAFATELAATRAHEGRAVRDDDLWTVTVADRSPAQRVLEAVLLAARATTDEQRVRHLGYLFAELTCSPDIDPALGLRTLQLAGSCSWRQLVLLAAVGRRERTPLPLTPLDDEPRTWSAWGAREELADLQRAHLLDPPPTAERPGARPRLRPADLRLTRRGVLLHRLLALDFVRADDVDAALAALA